MVASNLLNQVAAVQMQSRLDAQATIWLSEQVEQLKQAEQTMWVFDMAPVEFLDGQGLLSLVAARRAAYEANVQLVLCGVSKSIQMIFDLAQLDQVFAIVETAEALPVSMTNRLLVERNLNQAA
ncbi:STAS domain-containing protein [filamentous cyanobacterium LEGE 11480]|uniref:STAS domain-containing protein n=1 Tax=Romeriopsis navalis LEGE 11480 TaxID=2777977 RepID=A0A928VIH6_9CYAN|nr:STAS domain-containing protein [Romeriopsis navalis]MBE9028302.1 STAS domain-containing protein [Romeriopsis navalis LEGE 11480]